MTERIEIQNAVSPGHVQKVDARKYRAMRDAYLQVLPATAPGLTPSAVLEAVKPFLPQDLFPGGDKAGWWAKAVQLDLEAKGLVARATKPVRLYRA